MAQKHSPPLKGVNKLSCTQKIHREACSLEALPHGNFPNSMHIHALIVFFDIQSPTTKQQMSALRIMGSQGTG